MSLNQLTADHKKPWLNARVNDLCVDGTLKANISPASIQSSGLPAEYLYDNGAEVIKKAIQRPDLSAIGTGSPFNTYLHHSASGIVFSKIDSAGIEPSETDGQVLTTTSGSVEWADVPGGGSAGGLPVMFLAYNDPANAVSESPSGSGVFGYTFQTPTINSAGVTVSDAILTLPASGTWMVDIYANMELTSASGGTKRLNLYTVESGSPVLTQWTSVPNNTNVEVHTSVSIKAILPGGTQFFLLNRVILTISSCNIWLSSPSLLEKSNADCRRSRNLQIISSVNPGRLISICAFRPRMNNFEGI